MRTFSQFLQLDEAVFNTDAIVRLADGFKSYIEKIHTGLSFASFPVALKYNKAGVGDSYQIPLLNKSNADGISLAVCYEPRRGKSTLSSINVYLRGWSTDVKPDYEIMIKGQTNLVKAAAEVSSILKSHVALMATEQTMSMEGYLAEIRRDKKTGLALNAERRKEEKEKAAAQLKAAMAEAQKHGVEIHQNVQQTFVPSSLESTIPPDMHEELTAEEQYENMGALVNQVLRNEQKSLIIVGSAGVGKTYNVMQAVRKSGRPYQQFKGNMKSDGALYEYLFKNRQPNELVIFDDADSIFSYANMLKGALGDDEDPKEAYKVMYGTKDQSIDLSKWQEEKRDVYFQLYDAKCRGEGDEFQMILEENAHMFEGDKRMMKELEKGFIRPPASFQFLANLIIISNKKLAEFNTNEHLKAVVSRGAFFNLELTQDTVFQLLEKLLPTFENSKVQLDPNQKSELFKVVRETYKVRYPSQDQFPSFRNFVMLFPWMADNSVTPEARKKYIQRQIAIWNA